MCAICCQLLWNIPRGIEMVSVCTVPARGGRSCEHFGGYKTINRIPLPLPLMRSLVIAHWQPPAQAVWGGQGYATYFWDGRCCYIQVGQSLRDTRCCQYYWQVQSLFPHQPRPVLSWLQSVTLISGYRYFWSHTSVVVVYIVIELSTAKGLYVEWQAIISVCWTSK